MAYIFSPNYGYRSCCQSTEDRRVSYIYRLVFKPYQSVWEWGDLEQGKERSRERIDREIDSMMVGVRGWKKYDANLVRQRVHTKRLEFWEEAELQRNETKETKDETKDQIEKTRKDFEEQVDKMRKDFEGQIDNVRKYYEAKMMMAIENRGRVA